VQIWCAVRSKTLSLVRLVNIIQDQSVFLSAVGSAREHAGIHLRGLQEWASLYEDSAAYMQWIWRQGVSLLLSFATWRAVESVRQPGDAELLRDLDISPGTAHSNGSYVTSRRSPWWYLRLNANKSVDYRVTQGTWPSQSMMRHISLPQQSVAAGSGSSSIRQDSNSLGGESAPTGESGGSRGGRDTGEPPIEGSGGGAQGELSSDNCGIALYDSMPVPLTLLNLQYPPVRPFQGAIISVGAMWVGVGVAHKMGGGYTCQAYLNCGLS